MAELGEHDRAIEWVNRARELEPQEPRVLYNVACVFALLGDTDKSLDSLEASVDAGRRGREWMENDPDLASLSNHVRFRAILERLQESANLASEPSGQES